MKTYQDLFEEYSYQDLATQIIYSSVKRNQLAPAYLFTGPKGVGQKEIAIRFFEAISSKDFSKKNNRKLLESYNHPDLYIIEPTYLHQGKLISKSVAKSENFQSNVKPQIRLEQIKDLKIFLSKKPIYSQLSMILMEDIDLMNESASNALLKTIEEPSNGVIILISSKPEMLLETIKSRCQVIPFKPYNLEILFSDKIIKDLIEKFDDNHINNLLSISNGSPQLLIKNLKTLLDIPENILNAVNSLHQDKTALGALSLAKDVAEKINLEEQLVLINWMQHYYWNEKKDLKTITILDALRLQLQSYVSPRVAWEISLIHLISID